MHTHRSTLVTSPTTREKGRVEIRGMVVTGVLFAIFAGKKLLTVVSNEV
jgi:hypothetical protein